MLKLKDFPPSSDFKRVLARHHDDFVAMLTRQAPAAAAAAASAAAPPAAGRYNAQLELQAEPAEASMLLAETIADSASSAALAFLSFDQPPVQGLHALCRPPS
jgi:hypothetical protein